MTMSDAELSLGGAFQVFRKDRPSRGGGVVILISRSVNAVNVEVVCEHEIVIVDINAQDLKLRVSCCYSPPSDSAEDMCSLCECLEENLSFEHKNVIVGDFNLTSLKWNDVDVPIAVSTHPAHPEASQT